MKISFIMNTKAKIKKLPILYYIKNNIYLYLFF